MTTLGEGNTPLIELPRLGARLGVGGLYAKLETCNPTGSYKDRIAKRSMERALERGLNGWIATSSGNAATAFATYGRRAGVPGFLCVNETITREKLLPVLALGPQVVRISGTGDGGGRDTERQLFDAVSAAAAEHELYLGVTAHRYNDAGMRAVDEIAHEVVSAGLAPDLAYVPTGGGGLISAIARGFRQAGAPTAAVSCQPAGCAPIARCLSGELNSPVVERTETSISGLQLPGPPDGELAVEGVRAGGGWGAVSSDEEIVAAQRSLAREEGVFVEPAAACALACLVNDLRDGRVEPDASVVLVLTGSGFKDLMTLERATTPPPLATVDEVPGLVERWRAR
jgi:threonine synthase